VARLVGLTRQAPKDTTSITVTCNALAPCIDVFLDLHTPDGRKACVERTGGAGGCTEEDVAVAVGRLHTKVVIPNHHTTIKDTEQISAVLARTVVVSEVGDGPQLIFEANQTFMEIYDDSLKTDKAFFPNDILSAISKAGELIGDGISVFAGENKNMKKIGGLMELTAKTLGTGNNAYAWFQEEKYGDQERAKVSASRGITQRLGV
jgi:hypothetical protein